MTFKEAKAIQGYIMTIVNPSLQNEYTTEIEETFPVPDYRCALHVDVGSCIFDNDWNIIAGISALFGVTYRFEVNDQYFYLY